MLKVHIVLLVYILWNFVWTVQRTKVYFIFHNLLQSAFIEQAVLYVMLTTLMSIKSTLFTLTVLNMRKFFGTALST